MRGLCDRYVCRSVNRITDERGNGRRPNVAYMGNLTFGGDLDLHVDSGSRFHFLHHCGIRDFCTFVSISHTINGRFLRCMAK